VVSGRQALQREQVVLERQALQREQVVSKRQELQREQGAFLKVLTYEAVMLVSLALAAAAPWRRCWPRFGSCPGADLQCCARWVERGVWSWGRTLGWVASQGP
jgi:hypothetical protein